MVATSEEKIILLAPKRLGQPSLSLLKEMYPKSFGKVNADNLICEACPLVKLIKLLTTDNHHFSCSRFCWGSLLKHKSEVTKIFKNSCHLINRQFQVNIAGF